MSKDKDLTVREGAAIIRPRQFLRLETIIPAGTLELRKSGRGVLSFYWRVTASGRAKRYPIGAYDSSAPPRSLEPTIKGYSHAAARRAAEEMGGKHCAALGRGGYEAILAEERLVQQAEADAREAEGYTLERLYDLYVQGLRARNAETAKQARNLFNKNLKGPFAHLAATQANKVSTGQIADVLRPLIAAGVKTTARKLKAYLRSAYEQALDAEDNAGASGDIKKFKIKHNPVAGTRGIKQSRGADKRALMPKELRKYWQLIDVPGIEAAVLRLHFMLGGQRLEQFVRLKVENVHSDMVSLIDTKGRTGAARRIDIPRTAAIDEALSHLVPNGEYAISVTPGKHLSPTTIRAWSKKLVGDEITGFTPKRVRSGVTTLLTMLGVDPEVRLSLQSHEQSGVEKRHYNMYEFFKEKRVALERMHRWLVNDADLADQVG